MTEENKRSLGGLVKSQSETPTYKELFGALVKAQAEMPIIEKKSDNPFYKSKYADFAGAVSATRPCLTKYGLCVSQPPVRDNGERVLQTILSHISGEYIVSEMVIDPAKADAQGIGSYLSYMKRYAYLAIIGAATGDEDDDGNASLEIVDSYQASQIIELARGHEDVMKAVLKRSDIDSITDLPKRWFGAVMKYIKEEIAKKSQK